MSGGPSFMQYPIWLSSVSIWQKRFSPEDPFPQKEWPSQAAGLAQSRWILQVPVVLEQYSLEAQVDWMVTIWGGGAMQEQKVGKREESWSVRCLKRTASLDCEGIGRPWLPRHWGGLSASRLLTPVYVAVVGVAHEVTVAVEGLG